MSKTIRVKLIKILRKRLDEGVYFDIIADQIFSLIIDELPNNKVCGGDLMMNDEVEQCRGYNTYRSEVIKMLKGV